MTWLRRWMASARLLNVIACSASPGIGSIRAVEPRAMTRRSYATSTAPSSVSTVTVRASWSNAVARPRSSSACGHIIRRGTNACRGSMTPAATSGSSGV